MGGKKNAKPGKPAKDTKTAPKMKPEGAKDGSKRTPLGNFDQWKGRKHYTVFQLQHKRLHRGNQEYFVQWLGIPTAGSTWEPKENLIGPDGINAIQSYEEAQRLLLEQVIFISVRPRSRFFVLRARSELASLDPSRDRSCRYRQPFDPMAYVLDSKVYVSYIER